ncbi:hypothetical protein ViNHUV68_14390 [Vibrio sp. NH-UV-68]
MNMKLTLLTITGLLFIPSSIVNAAGGYSSVKVLLGNKSLDSDWNKDDSMETIGLQSTYYPASLPLGIALDFYGSGNEDKINGVKVETTVGELNLGLRYSPTPIGGVVSPYLGGGLSYASAELEQMINGAKTKYEDKGVGYWIGGGIEYLFTEHWSIGADVHYSNVDVELNGEKRDAGGVSWAATIGYRF